MQLPIIDWRGNKFVDQNGFLSSVAQNHFDALTNYLFKNVGSEGFVSPSQSAANLNTIAANINSSGAYTCRFGTILFNSDTNQLNVAINNGSGVPVFTPITTSSTYPISMADGGTGSDLIPSQGSLVYSTATDLALLGTSANGVLVTDVSGNPSISQTIPAATQANIQIAESQVTNLVSDLASKLNLSGGTMTGNLILNTNATLSLQAVPLQQLQSYTNAITINGTTNQITSTGSYPTWTLSFPSVLHTVNGNILDDGSANMTVASGKTLSVDNIVGTSLSLRINPSASGQNIYLGHDLASTFVTIGAGSTATDFSVVNSTSTFFHVANTGIVTTENNTIDDGIGGCTFGSTGAPNLNFGNGGGASNTNIKGNANWGNVDTAATTILGIASSGSIIVQKTINIGNNNSTPSVTTILGTINIQTSGTNVTTIGNSSSTLTVNAGRSTFYYPTAHLGTGSYLQVGATGDFPTNHSFGFGIASPAGALDYPFGICVGGGSSSSIAFSVNTAGVVSTLHNTIDNGSTGAASFAGPVTLPGNATSPLQAVPLQQVTNAGPAVNIAQHTYCGGF